MLTAGVLLPSLEGWRVDHRGIEKLALPDDILELILQRVEALPEPAHQLLTIASFVGNRFSLRVLAAVEKREEKGLADLLDQATRLNVLEESSPGHFSFVHDRIHEAFLSEVRPSQRRQLHLKVARGLESLQNDDPELVYALARHYSLGESQEIRERVYETNLAAGLTALAEFAFEEAYNFLEQAAHSSGNELAEWMEPLSEACERTGRVDQAMELLNQLLEASPAPLARSKYLVRLAQLRQSKLDRTRALDGCRAALSAVGKPVLEHKFLDILSMGYYFGLWLLAEKTSWGRRRARPSPGEGLNPTRPSARSVVLPDGHRRPFLLPFNARLCYTGLGLDSEGDQEVPAHLQSGRCRS